LSTTIFNNPCCIVALGFLGHGLAMLARRLTQAQNGADTHLQYALGHLGHGFQLRK
jgi:hypothetical protein